MTRDELTEHVRDRVREALGELGEESGPRPRRPWGLPAPVANTAVVEGALLAFADLIMASATPTPSSRRIVAHEMAERLKATIDLWSTPGAGRA